MATWWGRDWLKSALALPRPLFKARKNPFKVGARQVGSRLDWGYFSSLIREEQS